MKLKVALLAVAIGFSAQVSSAATDNSCNPFAFRGCGGSGAQYASSQSAAGHLFAAIRGRSAQAEAVQQRRGRGNGFGRLLRQLMRANSVKLIDIRDDIDLDEPIAIVPIETEDGQPGDGVSTVPVPAAGFLLLAGLGGLVMVRRKKS